MDISKNIYRIKLQDFFLVIFLSLAFGVFFDYAIINSSLGRVPKTSK